MKPAGIQMGRMGAVEDRSLDVRRQQSRARDLRGIAGAGDTLGPGEFPDAFALAPASHRFPPVGPGQGAARGHVRFRCGQGSPAGWVEPISKFPAAARLAIFGGSRRSLVHGKAMPAFWPRRAMGAKIAGARWGCEPHPRRRRWAAGPYNEYCAARRALPARPWTHNATRVEF